MTSNILRRSLYSLVACLAITVVSLGLFHAPAHAATGEFYLQVSPSPLVTTLKPGQQTAVSLKIRNAGTQTEQLTINPRSFQVNNTTGQVEFNDTTPPEIASWIQFGAKNFTIAPGQTFEQKIVINVPKEAGFSYSFAFLIQRQAAADQPQLEAGQKLKAQIAIFALLNVDRPGAIRQLQIDNLTTDSNFYEYLPVNLHIHMRNTGNTIVQPAGDVFIQRGTNDQTPITTLAANDKSGYILPGTLRTLDVQWKNGSELTLGNFRIGYYVAKAVVIYNDGTRDVPVTAEVSFWVIPWKILLGLLLVLLLIGLGVWSVVRKVWSISKGRKQKQSTGQEDDKTLE